MYTRKILQKLKILVPQIADQELLSRFNRVESDHKADGSVVTEADFNMQNRLLDALAEEWPEIALLGEEMTTESQQALLDNHSQNLWIVDPLDGTSNFSSGIPFFGVSIALLSEGEMKIGLIYDPVRRELFSALQNQGAWLNDQPLCAPAVKPALAHAMAMVDLKRLPAHLIQHLAQHPPYRSQRSFGSVALDWCWLATGRVQIYLHGGQKLWDYAAGQLIFQEAGGHGGLYTDYAGTRATRLNLKPHIGLAASSDTLFQHWSDWVKNHAKTRA